MSSMNKIHFQKTPVRQGDNTYFRHFTDEKMEAESYVSCGSNLTQEPSLFSCDPGKRDLSPGTGASEGLALALLKLHLFLKVSSPQGQGAMPPEFPTLRLLSALSRIRMGFLIEPVLSVDTTTGLCTWAQVVALTVCMEGACAVEVLLEYDKAGGGKRKGLGAGSSTPHSCQNSGQTVRSLNMNLPFWAVSKEALSR